MKNNQPSAVKNIFATNRLLGDCWEDWEGGEDRLEDPVDVIL